MKPHHLLLWAASLSTVAAHAHSPLCRPPDSTDNLPSRLSVAGHTDESDRLLMLKTNILPWCATVMNIEGEIRISDHISLSLPLWYCPWFIAERKALRIAALQPEGRWWFAKTGKGHFAAIHASVAWYNLKWGRYRYQDRKRPLLGAGITYGYAFRIHRNWGLEFSIGAGYANLSYDRFYNTNNGQLADTRHTSYFGLDHLSLSVVYHIGL